MGGLLRIHIGLAVYSLRVCFGFTLDSNLICFLGLTVDPHFGCTLDSHWVHNRFLLDLHRVHIGFALDSLRPLNGFTLDSHRIPFGHTLNSTSWTHTPNLLHMLQKLAKLEGCKSLAQRVMAQTRPLEDSFPPTSLSLEVCKTCAKSHGANTPSCSLCLMSLSLSLRPCRLNQPTCSLS